MCAQVLQVREDAVQGVLEEAEAKLQTFSQDKSKYEAMLTDLLVQALAKLKQPETKVKSRECDAQLVKVPCCALNPTCKQRPGRAPWRLVTRPPAHLGSMAYSSWLPRDLKL